MLDVEKVNKVVSCILAGNTIEETHSITGFSERTIQNYIKALNNPDYPNVFNPDLYDEVRKKQIETGKERKNNPTDFDKDLALANLILANNLSIEKAATQIGIDSELLYYVLATIRNPEVKEKLNPLLKIYKQGKLAQIPGKTQIEIILMALTFRVSYKILTIIFNTNLEDVNNMFQMHNEYRRALRHLDNETKNEDRINEKVAYVKAKNYWNERNKLIKQLNKAIKEKKKAQELSIKKQLRKLRIQIDDSEILKTKNKSFNQLNEVERNLYARFRIKYGFTTDIAIDYLGITRLNLKKCEEELAAKDKIYEEKLTFINQISEKQRRQYVNDYKKEMEQIMYQTVDLDYFQLNTTDMSFEDVTSEVKSTRGGGTR